jgi:hypothetical protein
MIFLFTHGPVQFEDENIKVLSVGIFSVILLGKIVEILPVLNQI